MEFTGFHMAFSYYKQGDQPSIRGIMSDPRQNFGAMGPFESSRAPGDQANVYLGTWGFDLYF